VVDLVCSESRSTGKTRVGINGNFLVIRVPFVVSCIYLLHLILLCTFNFALNTKFFIDDELFQAFPSIPSFHFIQVIFRIAYKNSSTFLYSK